MDKKIVNIGDIFVTRIYNLKGLALKNIDSIKEISYSILEPNKYLYKSIYYVDICMSENRSLFEKIQNYNIFIKYIGDGKFVEMETETSIICELNYNLDGYELVDKKTTMFKVSKDYETYLELLDDIQYIRENPLILNNQLSNNDEIIRPILEQDKIKYLKTSQQERIEALEKLKNTALEQFNKSIERQVAVDHEMALLEDRIKTFSKTK